MLNRYPTWERVTDANDISDLSVLLTIYDANLLPEQSKIGVGIDYFEKRPDQDHAGTTACFFVVRTDGTSVDFSCYVTVQPLWGEWNRIACERPEQHLKHAMALLAERVET